MLSYHVSPIRKKELHLQLNNLKVKRPFVEDPYSLFQNYHLGRFLVLFFILYAMVKIGL